MIKRIFSLGFAAVAACVVGLVAFADERPEGRDIRIVQCGDPQLGFSAVRFNLDPERGYQADLARFEQVIAAVNELKPDLCFIAGDMTHIGTELERDWPQLIKKFKVPFVVTPGNHDLGAQVTKESVERFERVFGYSYKSLKVGDWRFLCGNSQYWRPTDETERKAKYEAWVADELAKAKAAGEKLILASHIPPFTMRSDEPDSWENCPMDVRRERVKAYLDAGARFYLAGHTHTMLARAFKGMTILNAETTCWNFDGLPYGFRVLTIHPDGSYDWDFQQVGVDGDSAAILKTVNDRLAKEFISHDGLLLDYTGDIPTPEEIADLKPNAMGWWCPIENGSMFTGEWLPALMAEGPSRKSLVETCVRGLIKMSEVSDVPGFIARGTGTDGKSHHPCGSNDQTDPWFLGLCEYCRWTYADAALKAKALERIVVVAKALEANDWGVPCDGPFKGQNRGKLNGKGMPFWCVTRFLYMLQSLSELTGDAHWAELYAKAKQERLGEIECGAEIDVKSFKAAYGDCAWIYLSSAQALAGLIVREKNAEDRARMRKGLSNYAAHVAPLMKNRAHYKNTTERPFKYANWRTGYAWRVQKTQKDAEAVARSGKHDILGWRKDYERVGMANPLCAAAVCALSGEAAYRGEILATLRHYDYSTPNISEFFHAAVAAAALGH